MNVYLYLCPIMRTRDPKKEALIREKALEMIVKQGFDGFSMQKLAKDASVSPATLYIYFRNKEDLLNQLFNEVQHRFSEVSLQNFDPLVSFAEGLLIQWKNRLAFILEYPNHFRFHEQFRNSPLINHKDVELSGFRENMRIFITNAIKNGEMSTMEPEIFWSIAYGPLYSMIKFHLQEKSLMNKAFVLTEDKMKQALSMILKALKP